MHLSLLFLMAYFLTLLSFLLQRTHLLMTLLCLEGMMLTLVLILPSSMFYVGMTNMTTTALIMLTMGACEASLGLSVMVVMSRSHGSDMLNNLTSSKC